jgi:hypothetical protein
MAPEQGLKLPPPAGGLRMAGKAFFSFRQHHPQSMQLPVLPQQVLAAQPPWLNVPDAHILFL